MVAMQERGRSQRRHCQHIFSVMHGMKGGNTKREISLHLSQFHDIHIHDLQSIAEEAS